MEKKRKCFICAQVNFPRGNAGANYIQYLGMALKKAGYDVFILSNGSYESCEKKDNSYFYKSLEFIIPPYIKGIGIFEQYLGWIRYKKIIVNEQPTSGDVLVLYSANPYFISGLRSFAHKAGMKVAACVVDYPTKDAFDMKKERRVYHRFRKALEYEIPKCDVIFPISTYIDEIYKKRKCHSIVIPIMADIDEYNKEYEPKNLEGKRKIIYTATGTIRANTKDNFEEMIAALSKLSIKDLERIEFHITSFKNGPQKIEEIIKGVDNSVIQSAVRGCIHYHEWMEYEELIALYRTMDFLFIVRDITPMTLANFPSKVPEAMAFGIVPVVSEVGDYTKYYLHDGYNSIIFTGKEGNTSVDALKRALRLNEEEISKLSYNAYQTVKEKFDFKNWVNTISNALK